MNKKNQYVTCWLNISIYIIVLMVLIGGITRLTNSGLSITNWKPIMGIIPPISEKDWVEEFETYKKYPEYKKINNQMALKEYKKIYFWEYLHRMLGRFIGVLFILPFSLFYFNNYIKEKFTFNFIVLFALGLMQAVAGWMMVKSGLVDNPNVSHYRLAIHLVLAFLIIGYTYWTKLSLINLKEHKIKKFQYFNSLLNFIFIIFFLQIIYGAFTAGLSKEGLWNTFPLINEAYIPSGIFSMEPIMLNFIKNNKTILFLHPYIGICLMFLIFLFCYQIQKDESNIYYQYLVLVVFAQVILGMLTLISKSSILLALMHQVSAILLMLILLKIKHLLKYSKKS